MLGGAKEVEKIKQRLDVANINENIPSSKLLSKEDIGQIEADTYSRPIFFISLESCDTYTPMKNGVTDQSDPMFISFVKNNHWFLLVLEGEMIPIPPIVAKPRSLISKKASGWVDHLKDQLQMYSRL